MALKVLLIDDSPSAAPLLMELLANASMQLITAQGGRYGLDKTLLHRPDLILLDVNLPDINGFAVCRRLKVDQRTQSIPVIFMTAANDLHDRLHGLTCGGVDYICKPFSAAEVLARIRIHIDLSHDRLMAVTERRSFSESSDLVAGLPTEERRRDVLVRSATAYLMEHLSEPPAPAALAHLVGTNEKRLNQVFQEQFALPVFGWLREERMKQAHRLLTTTDTAVTSIGSYLGFSSPANFAKAFRARFGLSPSALRQQGNIQAG